MKTWEMLKELQVNPEKEFKSGNEFNNMICKVMDDCIEFIEEDHIYRVSTNREWGVLKESVNFMTAIKEFSNLKNIYCKTEYGEIKHYDPYSLDDVYFSEEDILYGEWFIS